MLYKPKSRILYPHSMPVPGPALYPQIALQRVVRQSYARRALAAMVVPLQESGTQQMADGRLAQRECFQTGHTGVAALGNGTTIACAPRLGLTRLEGF